jgi:formate dehydrogenase subunit gamma
MAATTRPPERPAGPDTLLVRFDWVERLLHWVNATLFLILVVTGAGLYLAPIGELFGRRALVEDIHVYSGLALPVPVLLALAGSWGRELRADVRRFNRWSMSDRSWVRALVQPGADRRNRMADLRVGKFNAGQKLNAAFVAGGGLVMLGTGVIMRWYHPWPLGWRTGATFVHDWLALSLGIVIVGHVWMALRDWDALRSMVVGTISRSWATRHAEAWVNGDDGPPPLRPEAPGEDVRSRSAPDDSVGRTASG